MSYIEFFEWSQRGCERSERSEHPSVAKKKVKRNEYIKIAHLESKKAAVRDEIEKVANLLINNRAPR